MFWIGIGTIRINNPNANDRNGKILSIWIRNSDPTNIFALHSVPDPKLSITDPDPKIENLVISDLDPFYNYTSWKKSFFYGSYRRIWSLFIHLLKKFLYFGSK